MNFWTVAGSGYGQSSPLARRALTLGARCFALGCLAVVALGAAGCNLHPEEPRQRQDFSDPPTQYGDTRFTGMSLPGSDAGPPAAR